MATIIYPAIVERSDGGFNVAFPDLPHCISHGATVQEAVLNAEIALGEHLLSRTELDEELGVPSSLDDIAIDPDSPEVARVLVRAEAPERLVRIEVTLPEGLLSAIDRIEPNRSLFLAQAASAELGRRALLLA
jgi:predicted RNase H-like HicB family nuclease